MKKLFILIVLSLIVISCKSESKSGESDLIRGEFIFIDDAAVIKGTDFIYGVVINDLTHELAKKIEPLQREEYDMVPVVIKGIVKPNPEEGWEEIVEIKEIIGVSAPTSELPTKIKSSDQIKGTEEASHKGHNH
ncbi:hypothetical protein [Aquimarina muelleri]|uniref:Uncharacterized protein n=1 Tax=Aquimarina muelleri TaxID=279356 RepID=A0A918N460_9FLAO|nr:hypothetical protein [Aquimarina muelleri]MCX2763214.1 hypothetical protein [Aquimarina muelleri]GGX19995.1 hypothetical protein GCM10007384_21720 [Aquimarina muelleri]